MAAAVANNPRHQVQPKLSTRSKTDWNQGASSAVVTSVDFQVCHMKVYGSRFCIVMAGGVNPGSTLSNV